MGDAVIYRIAEWNEVHKSAEVDYRCEECCFEDWIWFRLLQTLLLREQKNLVSDLGALYRGLTDLERGNVEVVGFENEGQVVHVCEKLEGGPFEGDLLEDMGKTTTRHQRVGHDSRGG